MLSVSTFIPGGKRQILFKLNAASDEFIEFEEGISTSVIIVIASASIIREFAFLPTSLPSPLLSSPLLSSFSGVVREI